MKTPDILMLSIPLTQESTKDDHALGRQRHRQRAATHQRRPAWISTGSTAFAQISVTMRINSGVRCQSNIGALVLRQQGRSDSPCAFRRRWAFEFAKPLGDFIKAFAERFEDINPFIIVGETCGGPGEEIEVRRRCAARPLVKPPFL
jgi:hypothetical protein